ncbi:MAG: hypothetical protein HND52_15090 [Ignavibacteriae bacterium]|nr:hypothetical protein [Ignavibacteriota bacterium]NOG99280.1 hypothetical protein [Ignavibacteriota bacterium]
MGILSKHQIIEYLEKGELVLNPRKKENGAFNVEPASYDLSAGTFIWKETNIITGKSEPISKFYNQDLPLEKQDTVTLQPGQVMFVITHEEVKLPKNICGTVYAKNCFSREGILALTTGHVDPGIQCPIVIRLINLRSIPKTFRLGEPIYTIVFEKLESTKESTLTAHDNITMKKTYERTLESVNAALGNALNDLSFTQDFIKKEEFKSIFAKQFFKTVWGWVIIVAALIGIFASILAILDSMKN